MKNLLSKSLLATLLLVVLVPVTSAKDLKENPLLSDTQKLEEIAAAFGITVETLTDELESGKNVKQIAIEYEVSKDIASEYIKHHPRLNTDQLEKIADELSITVDEVKAALKSKTLKDLFEAQGLDIKVFMKSIGAPGIKHKK
jgi:uncharacterized protein (DUF2342 family)